MTTTVLILGSAPSAVAVRDWDLSAFDAIVAINNAWQLRPDWTHHIHPEDFPEDRRPVATDAQSIITYRDYVPIQNRFGGFLYAGGTMAFTAAYWALGALTPQVIAFMGCDMVYPKTGNTHFYGTGTADPLRADPTLTHLGSKARRFQAIAAGQGCSVANLSTGESVLPYPRTTAGAVSDRAALHVPMNASAIEQAQKAERDYNAMELSGRYWENLKAYDPKILHQIDALWDRV